MASFKARSLLAYQPKIGIQYMLWGTIATWTSRSSAGSHHTPSLRTCNFTKSASQSSPGINSLPRAKLNPTHVMVAHRSNGSIQPGLFVLCLPFKMYIQQQYGFIFTPLCLTIFHQVIARTEKDSHIFAFSHEMVPCPVTEDMTLPQVLQKMSEVCRTFVLYSSTLL